MLSHKNTALRGTDSNAVPAIRQRRRLEDRPVLHDRTHRALQEILCTVLLLKVNSE